MSIITDVKCTIEMYEYVGNNVTKNPDVDVPVKYVKYDIKTIERMGANIIAVPKSNVAYIDVFAAWQTRDMTFYVVVKYGQKKWTHRYTTIFGTASGFQRYYMGYDYAPTPVWGRSYFANSTVWNSDYYNINQNQKNGLLVNSTNWQTSPAFTIISNNGTLTLAICVSNPNASGYAVGCWAVAGISTGIKITDAESWIDRNPIAEEAGAASATFDNTTASIPYPDDTLTSAISAIANVGSLLNVYHITAGTLHELTGFLWSDSYLSNIKKYFNNPSDAISGLFILPFSVTDTVPTNIIVGNVDSGKSANKVSQFAWVDCGAITIPEYWANFSDYSQTTIKLYAPFVGYMPIDTTYVMNKSINVKYKVDCFTGAFVCFVRADSELLYTFTGNMAYDMPISSATYSALSSTLKGVGGMTALLGAGITLATGGAALPAVAAGVAGASAVASAVSDSYKPNINHSGNYSGNTGIMGYMKPYVIIERPIQQTPSNYKHTNGFPCFITYKLSDLSGYTVVNKIHLENVIATKEEKDMLEQLLYSGVIL